MGSRTVRILKDEPDVPKWIFCKDCDGTMKLDTKFKLKKGVFKVSWKCKKCKSLLRRTYYNSGD